MKNFLKIFAFFLNNYRKETILVISLIIISGLVEAIGIAAFLPFFQIILEGEVDISYIPEGALRSFITENNIPLNFTSVSALITVTIGLKALILWAALRKVGQSVAKISADLRARLLAGLLQAKWRFFVQHTLGTSLNAIVMETFTSSMAFISLARCVSAIVQFSVYAIAAALISWEVFIGTFVMGLFLVVILWGLVKVARSAGLSQISLAKEMLNHLAEMLQGIKPLRAMALEKKFMTLLSSHSKGLEKAQADQLISSQSMRVFHEPLMVITAITALYVLMQFGQLENSALAVMVVIFLRLLKGMNGAQVEYQRLVTQESALWSLLDTIEKTEDAAENWAGDLSPESTVKSITFNHVNFSHEGFSVLSDVDFSIAPHSLTALIGASGSGKTTILDLLSGFYKPDQGTVNVNGQDLCTLDLTAWRKIIGFVPQDVFLFNDDIKENILMGRNDLNDQDMWEALEMAGAKTFVDSLPQKLHAPVGEGGRKLSGGQRQRIAIARAIIHKPQILLLDEATSALDTQTELTLLKTLQKLAEEMTVIFVSHNPVVKNYAQHVYKVEQGTVIKEK